MNTVTQISLRRLRIFNQQTIKFCQKLNIKLPIIQAPMAGNIVSLSLMKAVAEQGGLASLPLGYLTVVEAKKAIEEAMITISAPFLPSIYSSQVFLCLNLKSKKKQCLHI